jgi:sRNA-binding protein
MKRLLVTSAALLLGACASAPQPYCIPPDYTRDKFGSVPTTNPAAQEEYARCKAREAEAQVDAKLKEQEARGRAAEQEQLERERQQMEQQDPDPQ